MTCLPSARTPKAAVSFETTILTSDSPGYLLFGATSTLKIATNIILEMENDLKTTMIFSIRNIAKGERKYEKNQGLKYEKSPLHFESHNHSLTACFTQLTKPLLWSGKLS